MKKVFLISSLCLIVDQITKYLIISKFVLNESLVIIDNFFSITNVRNYGAAWSILEGNTLFLILVGFITIFFIYFYFLKNKRLNVFETLTYGMLIGGILGNLVDRIVYGYVIDFLDFKLLSYNFPVFNFADVFIVVSALFIILLVIKENDYEKN